MKRYLFGILTIALVVAGSAFMKKNDSPSKKMATPPAQKNETATVREDDPNACVWLQFIGSATDFNSVRRCDNWIEFSGDPTSLCNNVNQRACAICVKTSALQGTAPNRFLIGTPGQPTTAAIFFNQYVPLSTWYVVLGPGSDAEQVRNRS